jgi:selenocysteine lyase/cysteine desulfurase
MAANISESLIKAFREAFFYVERDSSGTERIFFDNAAGSLVLDLALASIEQYSRISSYGGAHYPDSVIVDELMEEARTAVATLINAPSGRHIFTGESTTAVFRRLAEAILPTLRDGSRIIVSAADHNANIDPWRSRAAELPEKGLDVRMAKFDPITGTIDLNYLESLVDERVALMAVSHASNALGAENPVREIRGLLDEKAPEALLIVDGVHFIPHGPVDVQAMRADVYAFSSYKIFAQRGLSYAFGSERVLRLPHYKLAPAPDTPPETWEWGFRNPADFAPIIDVVEYLVWIGTESFPWKTDIEAGNKRRGVKLGTVAIRQYENLLVHAMLDGRGNTPGLRGIDGVTIYGIQDPPHYDLKEPTFCFNIQGRSASDVARQLWDQYRIVVRSGDHYAMETHKHLGVAETVRASLAHYNTLDEVKTFLEAVQQIAKQ